ncbi:MAG: hypothetical protein AAF216_04490 [Pseudomonadota bacterium]
MSQSSKIASATVLIIFALIGVVGCASHDRQNVHLLGEATEHNAAVQSVRDLDEHDLRPVEGAPT